MDPLEMFAEMSLEIGGADGLHDHVIVPGDQ
jgi:hypothetical protein